MPRIKQQAAPPSTSLNGLALAFPDAKRSAIPLHHADLASKTFPQLEDEITQAGGRVVSKVGPGVSTHLVTTEEQYLKSGVRVKDAIQHNIPIVNYGWLVASLESAVAVDESYYLLHETSAPTTSNPPAPKVIVKADKKGDKRSRDEDEDDSQKVNVKKVKVDNNGTTNAKATNGTTSTAASDKSIVVPVDEHYPNQRCQVYQDEEGVYLDATLNQTESGKNANKFYRIQMLQHGNGDHYTWTRWGRVGDVPGQSKMLGNGSLQTALTEFQNKFKDKTGLAWQDRDAAPKPKKYTMIEINYGESDGDDDLGGAGSRRDSKVSLSSSSFSEAVESKLPEAVGRLMSLIFNNDYFNSTLAELEYDASKMPLGKLSKKTLLKGYEVLKDLSTLINNPTPAVGDPDAVSGLSDQYYSLIPHAFNRAHRPPILSRMDMIKKEVTLLEALTDMQLANEIMKTAKSEKNQPDEKLALVDRQYSGLKLQEMTPLDSKTTEFKELSDYLIKSAGSTHSVKYQVQDIFRIERMGEGDRFEAPVSALVPKAKSDRRLLWHGSRTTNFGGILSQGLRIAPPEAPASGYMFGKGIYLANISTKSAGYCASYTSGGTGLLLLCEAELGKPSLKLTDADYNAGERAAKEGYLSTWGVGQTTPKGWKDASCVSPELKGVLMPDVKDEPGKSNVANAYLQYDEFICYAVEQVKLRYLLKVKID